MVTASPANATVVATIPWAPEGPLPRRLEPVDISSIARPGPALERAARSRVRTLPDGALNVVGAPDETGESTALRVDEQGTREPVLLGPDAARAVGWRLIDFLGHADGGWTLIELVPGPPDQARVRRVSPDGTTAWQSSATAGSPEALERLLGERGEAVFAVTGGAPRRLFAIDPGGAVDVVTPLDDDGAHHFMNGEGRIGFVGFDPGAGTRSWVTIDASSGARSELALDPESAWGLDLPLGMDARGRPYGNRYGTIVRFDSQGRVDWEFEVRDAIVDEGDVWVARQAPAGDGLVILPLTAPNRAAVSIDVSRAPGAWRLAGRTNGAFVLHRGEPGGAGELTTVGPDGSLGDPTPASEDVWLSWFDLQLPSGPAVTDAGGVDLATRGPDGLHVIRVTPGDA